MLKFTKGKQLFKRFQNNEDGNIALTFAISTVAIIGCMGAAMDFTTLSNASARSQAVADQAALSAAIFVKNNDRPPKDDSEGLTQGSHSAESLGYEFKGFVDGGAGNVDVNVVYDDNAKEARVTVSGKTVPTFIQILGKKDLDFSSEAVVSYLDIDEKHPASIALVLDTSGSMAWDEKLALNVRNVRHRTRYGSYTDKHGTRPAGAYARITGLKNSVDLFSGELNSRLGTEDASGLRTIRMGMLPYSSQIVSTGRVNMKWGYVTPSETTLMTPSGNTNSNPPMDQARRWMNTENDVHRNEADRKNETYREPLKFIIFMSDGQNTVGTWDFTPDNTAPVYWHEYETNKYRGLYVEDYNGQQGYVRGHLSRSTDRETIQHCNDMKAQGTEIFTIGYALEVGSYVTNNRQHKDEVADVNIWNQTNAYNLLQSCASSADNFVKANDAEGLEAAFDTIQNAIVTELIRIKS